MATFFCLGTRVEANPELVDEIAGRGHQVETHGYRHEHHLARGPRWVARDLRAAREAMEACGMRPTWYRPSYGQITGSTLVAARRQGLRLVLWSAWGREWTTLDPVWLLPGSAGDSVAGPSSCSTTATVTGRRGCGGWASEALDPIAAELERRRLRAVTLNELTGLGSSDETGS